MNPATQALASGFSRLVASSGERLKLLRLTGDPVVDIGALVDRTPEERNEKGLNFLPDRASVIEHFDAGVDPRPLSGETFVDENDVNHRIQRVHVIDGFLCRCICVSSE